MDKLRALRYFKRTAELNSFSLAAKEFDVPASSISRRIKDLESELGIELLQRTTRNVSTTELGSVYYEMIVEVLQRLNDADELISQRLDAIEGKIRISTMPSYGEKVLAPVLQKFRQQYPAIFLDLDFSHDLTVLGKDAVDIAIRAGNVPQERVLAKNLSKAEFKLVATTKLLQDLQTRYDTTVLSVEDLQTCPTLQYKGKYGALTWWCLRNNQWQTIEINPVFWCNSGETLLEATLAGEGLSLFPFWWVSPYLASGELVEVPVDLPLSNRQNQNLDVFILYQQAKYKIPKIKLCVDFIIQHLG
ncbi:LysR family transcriptional regulator [Amphritea sp. HPY]|uniref:LysR family transcriptional regulator n=1 Tax=Amphritea sp. HPY TaxID=3421652 RepID=UPI003D7EA845